MIGNVFIFLKNVFIFNYAHLWVGVGVGHVYMSHTPVEARKRCQILWSWSYRWLQTIFCGWWELNSSLLQLTMSHLFSPIFKLLNLLRRFLAQQWSRGQRKEAWTLLLLEPVGHDESNWAKLCIFSCTKCQLCLSEQLGVMLSNQINKDTSS